MTTDNLTLRLEQFPNGGWLISRVDKFGIEKIAAFTTSSDMLSSLCTILELDKTPDDPINPERTDHG